MTACKNIVSQCETANEVLSHRQFCRATMPLFRRTETARYLHTAVGVQQCPPRVSNNSLRIHCAVNPLAKTPLYEGRSQNLNFVRRSMQGFVKQYSILASL